MSNTTSLVNIDLLRRIASLTTAGASDSAIADQLHAEGFVVPRDGAFDHRWYRRSDGYNLSTSLHDPSRWTGAAVGEVRASPEYTAAAEAGFAGGSTALTV